MMEFGPAQQLQIYSAQTPPSLPVSFEDWETRARAVLSDAAFGYIAGGAGAGDTMLANRSALQRRFLRPRVLRDVSNRDLSVRVLDTAAPYPVWLAPVGVLSIAHPEAELAVARAARATQTPLVLSTVSSVPLEAVASGLGDTPRWFQLYPGKDREIMLSLVQRAERSGYSAIVVTVDTPMLGWREWDLRNAYLPFLQGQGLGNYLTDPVFRARLSAPPEEDPVGAVREFLAVFVNSAFSWEDFTWLRSRTGLPLLIKGITHPDDARRAVELGTDGVIVSNHGGRQVDGAIGALDALPSVRAAAGSAVSVLFDSGVRRGADVVKALALGAEAILVGRPYVYGLAVAGEAGVEAVLRLLAADLDLEVALCGFSTVAEIDESAVTTL